MTLRKRTEVRHREELEVNRYNFDNWMRLMYSGDLPQGTGALFTSNPKGPVGYCCLGLGCALVPNMPVEITFEYCGDRLVAKHMFGAAQVDGLAPIEFIEWLGLKMPISEDGDPHSQADIFPDYPDLLVQGREIGGYAPSGTPTLIAAASAAGMNDAGMSFEQIADTFRYFGIGGARA